MTEFTKYLITVLTSMKWQEPTKDKFPVYSKKPSSVYFEDIHYIWRNFKPKKI